MADFFYDQPRVRNFADSYGVKPEILDKVAKQAEKGKIDSADVLELIDQAWRANHTIWVENQYWPD